MCSVWLLCRLIFDIQWHNCDFVENDLGLNFQCQTFNWLFWQVSTGICKRCYCHQIGIQVFVIVYHHCKCCTTWLTYIFKITIFDMWISVKRWELAKNAQVRLFIEDDISHRMGPLRFVFFGTLTFIFKVKYFLAICYAFAINICAWNRCPGWFASTRTASAVLLLLF